MSNEVYIVSITPVANVEGETASTDIFIYTYIAHIFSRYVIDNYYRNPETLFFSIFLSIKL